MVQQAAQRAVQAGDSCMRLAPCGSALPALAACSSAAVCWL